MIYDHPIIISTISEKEMAERYNRNKQPKLIVEDDVLSPPSSPPLTKHVIQLSSGRRNGIQTKNSPNSQRRSEKRVSSRGPTLEDGKLKETLTVLIPTKIEEKIPSKKANVPLDGKIIFEEIKDPNPIVSGRRQTKTEIDGEKIIYAKPKSRDEQLSDIKKKKKEPKSPQAERRSPRKEAEMRLSNRRDSSSRRRETKKELRPLSPHRRKKKPHVGIKIDGEDLSSEDLDDIDNSFSSSSSISIPQYRSEQKRDSTGKHIRSRKAALDEKVEKEFYPEDDEHLKAAIKTALEESKKKSIQEALDEGLELNAEVLKSLSRPKAFEEVVETLVTQRREKLREAKRKPKVKLMEEEEPEIETMEEPESKPKMKMTVDDNIPVLEKVKEKISETVKVEKLEEEKNVKLPPAFAKQKRSELKTDIPWAIGGENDRAYDPLNLGGTVEDDQQYEGDELYEESSEDEDKLTIDERKDEMMYRFRCVKESYPTVALPRITKRMKLAKMVRLYEHVQSKIKLKVKTSNFKILMIGGFLIMQFLGNKLSLDMNGFTVNQMNSINIYSRYLRELGESDWSGIGIELPIMVRLPFFMFVNAAIFVVAKFIFKRTGKDYTVDFQRLYSQLLGNDDFAYIKDDGGNKGMDHGNDEEGGDNGGLFGMLKSFIGMMGGGGGEKKDKPKRGEAAGPTTYKKRAKK